MTPNPTPSDSNDDLTSVVREILTRGGSTVEQGAEEVAKTKRTLLEALKALEQRRASGAVVEPEAESFLREKVAAVEALEGVLRERKEAGAELERRLAEILPDGKSGSESLATATATREARREELLRERERLRDQRRALLNQRTESRQKEVDELNRRFEGRIVLKLGRRLDRDGYRLLLVEALMGSGLDRKRLARKIAEALPPYEFIDAVERREIERLGRTLETNEAEVGKLVEFLAHRAFRGPLEDFEFEVDHLDVQVFVEGELKPLDRVSPEIKANTMRAIMLREGEWNLPRG